MIQYLMYSMIQYREKTLKKRAAEIEGAFQQGLDYNEFRQEKPFFESCHIYSSKLLFLSLL